MKQNPAPGRWVAKLTGLLFVIYAVYNIYTVARGSASMPPEGILITVIVALVFAAFTFCMWTSGINTKNIRFLVARRAIFITGLVILFLLKLRIVAKVYNYLDFSEVKTVLYALTYAFNLAAFLIMIIYYAFVLKNLPLYPRASAVLPIIAMVLFICCLVMEAIMFFVFRMLIEPSPLRTVIIRPVFNLGFVGACVYFLLLRKDT